MKTHHQQTGRKAARFLKAMAIGQGNVLAAKGFIEGSRWIDELPIKAAVDALMTGVATGLSAEIPDDFVALVYPQTIIGRLEYLRRVPFETRLIQQVGGATAYWVAEGNPKPVSLAQFSDGEPIKMRKVVALAVMTQELLRFSEGEPIIARDLGNATIKELDASFIDPANAGVSGERPASITNGLATIAATADPAVDLAAAVKALVAAGGNLITSAWVMHPDTAVILNLRGGAFEKVGALGGELVGLPVITSASVPSAAAGRPIVLVDADGIELAGADTAELRTTTEAVIQMQSAPTSGAVQNVSLWQTNNVAVLAEIPTNWRVVRAGSVVMIEGADY